MGLKLPKAFNYRLSHQDKAGFTVDLQGTGKGKGGGRTVAKQTMVSTNRQAGGQSIPNYYTCIGSLKYAVLI